MHELQVTERILDVVLDHASRHEVKKVVFINLRIGDLSDLEGEWIQRYFEYLSRGTLAETAKLVIEKMPIVLECDECSCSFEVQKQDLGEAPCPECGEMRCRLISGREYTVSNMEVI